MDFLAQLSDDETFANPLSVLLEITRPEFADVKLAMINTDSLDPENFQITDFCSHSQCPIYSAKEMLNGGTTFPVQHGFFIEKWKNLTVPFLISRVSCKSLLELKLERYDEAIVVPIWIKGMIKRWIVLVDYNTPREKIDLTKLLLLFNYAMSNILRTEQKRQLDEARRWIDEELDEITRLQSLLLPQDKIQIKGTQIAFKYQAFKAAGGDYLDLFSLPYKNGTAWGGVIADVTGHGPSAAVEAAMLDAILRTFPGDKNTTPADVANYLNKNFFTRRDRGKFITAMFFSYQSETRTLKYLSAGHPYGYIKRGNEVIVLDKSQDIPIGVLHDFQWEHKEIKILPDDILFIYTDVVLETRNAFNEEFGAKRLQQTIQQSPHCPFQLVERVESSLYEYSGKSHLTDDMTLSAIKID